MTMRFFLRKGRKNEVTISDADSDPEEESRENVIQKPTNSSPKKLSSMRKNELELRTPASPKNLSPNQNMEPELLTQLSKKKSTLFTSTPFVRR